MTALDGIAEAWRLAIQKERDAYDFYSRMAQSATDEGTRSLFEMLVEQEKQHEAILEAEYRRLFEPDLELGREILPITWYEWHEESFELAEALELPVMLYITAPWCEPCHLMEQSTLDNADVVAAINADFIPIMLDADKRPDVDSRYSRGGWPTTAFLSADGEVLESHNFLTTEQMIMALNRIKARYAGEDSFAAPTIAIRPGVQLAELEEPPEAVGELKPELTDAVAGSVLEAFDPEHGGFGATPKFHHADVLEFALATAHRTGDERLAGLVHRSLEAMAEGGIHDRVGGGFFRYSTTADWSEPHLEKMSGDQAQLLSLYLRAYQATGRPAYLDTAQGILEYIDTVLWDRGRGYFYSSQEADPDYYALDAGGRAKRDAPYVDRTAYTERNAAVASAYMLASAVLDEPRYADLATRALDFIWQECYVEGLGMHHYFDNRPRVPGLLADQVSMASALLDAYEHFGREAYLQRAETLVRFTQNALRDGDHRYFDTVAAPEAVGRLRRRNKPFCENIMAAAVNLRLAVRADRIVWPRQVDEAFQASNRARQESEQIKTEARSFEEKTLTDTGGPNAAVVLDRLRDKDLTQTQQEEQVAQLAGQVQTVISEARAYRTRVVEEAKANAEYLTSLLPEYRKRPELVLQKIYQDAVQQVLAGAEEKIIIQPVEGGKSREIRVMLNRDPQVRKPAAAETK